MALHLPSSHAVLCSRGLLTERRSPGYGRRAVLRVRSSDLKDLKPSGDEWKPPSDWDNAWKAYKKLSESNSSTPTSSTLMKSTISSSNSGSGSNSPSSSSGRKKGLFSNMEQYVSRSPSQADYPLSEEIDPLKRSERQLLSAWTNPRFTYAGFGVVAILFVYMAVIVGPPPS
jgi:hypothetical protein